MELESTGIGTKVNDSGIVDIRVWVDRGLTLGNKPQ